MNRALSPRLLPWLVAGAAALVLATAYVLEAFGWAPCELCLRQRVPYWIGSAAAAIAGLLALPQLNKPLLSSLLMAGVSLVFLVGGGLAVQQIGVEQGWWKYQCSGGIGSDDIGDLMNSFKPIVLCDKTRPLFGITLATYNLASSAALAWAAALNPYRILRRGTAGIGK